MIFEKTDLRPRMAVLAREEIADTLQMKKLCEADSRIGYHAEVESYLFHSEKLQARVELLKELLENEFPKFNCNLQSIRKYAGEIPDIKCIKCSSAPEHSVWYNAGESKFRVYRHQNILVFELKNVKNNFQLEFEPCRLAAIKYYNFNKGKFIDAGINKTSQLRQDGESMRIEIYLDEFSGFRRSPNAPVRFNLTCDGKSFRRRHPFPERLCCGNCNPHDLYFIRFVCP